MFYVGYIVVEDGDGVRYRVRKFRGQRFFRPIVRYVLDSGERLEPVDGDTFQSISTGERLLQLR